MGHAFDLLAYYLSSQIYMRARIMAEFKILIDPDKSEMATRFQVATSMWIKESLKYRYQSESDFPLASCDI